MIKTIKCKPKDYGVFYSRDWTFMVSYCPQQKWEATKYDDDRMMLSHKNTSIKISNEDFEKMFKEI